MNPEERDKELVEKIKQGKIRCRKSLVKAIMATLATPNTPEEDEIIIDVVNDYFRSGGSYWGERRK